MQPSLIVFRDDTSTIADVEPDKRALVTDFSFQL
jgi:hypothetical protein